MGFGVGARGSGNGGSGGGGGWYGGAARGSASSNGGSSYVFSSATASDYPSGCKLNSSFYLNDTNTFAGNQSFPVPAGGNETGHSGDGYARITLVE